MLTPDAGPEAQGHQGSHHPSDARTLLFQQLVVILLLLTSHIHGISDTFESFKVVIKSEEGKNLNKREQSNGETHKELDECK